jgi:hypothetical protein
MTRLSRTFLGLAVLLFALGADDATKTFDAEGMTFDVPTAWKDTKPADRMRKAQWKLDPAKGDEDPANLILSTFPNPAGGVEGNVKRWQSQFKDENGKNPEAKTEKVKGKNVEVTRVELAGVYNNPFDPARKAYPHYRLLGAIVIAEDGRSYFLRLIGPEKTVNAAKADFDKMLKTIRVE